MGRGFDRLQITQQRQNQCAKGLVGIPQTARHTCAVLRPQQKRQLARRRLHQQLLVNVVEAPDGRPEYRARLELMRDGSLQLLASAPQQTFAQLTRNPHPTNVP